MCSSDLKNKTVTFTDGETTIDVDNPTFLPGPDLRRFAYAYEIGQLGLPGIDANYGSYYSTDPKVVDNPGRTPLIYQVGPKGKGFLKIIKVSSKIITPQEAVLVIVGNFEKNSLTSTKILILFSYVRP